PHSNPPNEIPNLISTCAQTSHVHYGIPKSRKAFQPLYWMISSLFEGYCRKFLKVDLQRNSETFRVMDRNAVNQLIQVEDQVTQMRVLLANIDVTLTPFEYLPTEGKGGTKKGLFEQVDLAFDLLVATSVHPMRWLS
ncbi:hypothetical protein, partial [Staphylococcus aureus]|uniref:hypothetical protein n=1 Tax=Staphylococcus aureus TaxID=1280 RepID=UPI0039BDF6A9